MDGKLSEWEEFHWLVVHQFVAGPDYIWWSGLVADLVIFALVDDVATRVQQVALGVDLSAPQIAAAMFIIWEVAQ